MGATWFRRLGGVNLGRLAADRKKALSPALFSASWSVKTTPAWVDPYGALAVQRIGLELVQPPETAQVMGPPVVLRVGVSTYVADASVVDVGVTVMMPARTVTLSTWVVVTLAGMPFVPTAQSATEPASWAQRATAVL